MWKLQGGRRRKLKSPPQTGKVCLILEETDAWDAAHDTHIDMWPRWHPEWHTHHCICCAPSVLSYRFNNLLWGGEGIGPGQSSIISAQKKIKCFMQRMDTKKKKQFHKKKRHSQHTYRFNSQRTDNNGRYKSWKVTYHSLCFLTEAVRDT